MWRVAGTNRMCNEMMSQVSKNSALLRAVAYPSARAQMPSIMSTLCHIPRYSIASRPSIGLSWLALTSQGHGAPKT
jgi:hypothetical protein